MLRRVRQARTSSDHFLEKSSVELGGVRFFGKSSAWLERRLAEPFDGPTVVVTHHLSAWGSVSTRHRDDLVTAAFASDLAPLVERYQPALWIHGQTPQACDYLIGQTRIVCNPRGYP